MLLKAAYLRAASAHLKALLQLEVLRRCWLEQYWLDDGVLRLRDAKDTWLSPTRRCWATSNR